MLSLFTQYALNDYYTQIGQLARYVGLEDYERFCTELFWPEALHTFPLEVHRRRLVAEIKSWAAGYIGS